MADQIPFISFQLNPPVEALSLKGNNIEPKGASYIAEMLSENMYITELVISNSLFKQIINHKCSRNK